MEESTTIVATRKSALALAQCRAWMDSLRAAAGAKLSELHVTTTGDRIQDRSLQAIGGKGLFIKEIEAALLEGRAHLAVHSMKDLPAELAPGLTIASVPLREDPRDAIKTRSGLPFRQLPSGARVGTSSLRRSCQLRRLRPDLEFVPIRGNVDTRLRRCEEGVVDAVVLAYAGLRRLGLAGHATEVLPPETCLPAIGQGALAIEVRTSDADTRHLVAQVNHSETAIATAAERGILEAAEGNCQLPIAGFGERSGAKLRLRALLADEDGARLREQDVECPWPAGVQAARECGLAVGAALKHARD